MRTAAKVLAILAVVGGLFLGACTILPSKTAETGAGVTSTSNAQTTSTAKAAATTTIALVTTTTAPPVTTTSAPTTTTTVKSGYEWKYGEAVTFDGMIVTVDKPVKDPAPKYVDEGKVVWVALVTITNQRAEPFDYSPGEYALVDSEGFVYDFGFVMSSKQELNTDTLTPGQMVKGYVVFQLPPSAVPAQMKFKKYVSFDAGNYLAIWR